MNRSAFATNDMISGGGVLSSNNNSGEPVSSNLLREKHVIREAGRLAIKSFLEENTCFSVIRISGKVVVFDTRIPIQLAFYALVEHGTTRSVSPFFRYFATSHQAAFHPNEWFRYRFILLALSLFEKTKRKNRYACCTTLGSTHSAIRWTTHRGRFHRFATVLPKD